LHKPEYTTEQAIAAFDEVVARVRDEGVSENELGQLKVKFRSDFYSMLEGGMGSYMPRFGLMHYLACFTLFDGDPQRINTVLDEFLAVAPSQVRDIAQKMLVPHRRSVLIREPLKPTKSNGNGASR
jgi:zinc protease